MIDVRSMMLENADPKMAAFNKKLTPGDEVFLGLRAPMMRNLAKDIAKNDWRAFLASDPREYHEDLVIQGMVISYAKMDLDERLHHISEFIPKITTWAICDMFTYKAKKNEREAYWNFLLPYLKEPSEFGMRFAVVSILGNFIDDEHIDHVLKLMDSTKHDGYYLKMGVAWALSVCFVKFPEKTMEYLNDNTLDDFTYNKTLQKIVESFRVDDPTKTIIKGMRRKVR